MGITHYYKDASLDLAFCLVATGILLADLDAFFPFFFPVTDAAGTGVDVTVGVADTVDVTALGLRPGIRTICSVGSTLKLFSFKHSNTRSPYCTFPLKVS